MQFTITIPDHATMRVGKQAYVVLPPGIELHRVHPTIFKPNQFNDTDRGDARFSPIHNVTKAIIPTIYGAESFECAACEIILRCPDVPPIDPRTGLPTFQVVYPADFAQYGHSVVRTTLELKLIDLTVGGQRKIGVDQNALLAGPKSTYPATRGWAEHIHAHCPDAQGLYYNSFQLGPLFAVVLFGDRLPASALVPESTRLVANAPCHDDVRALAQSLSIEYEDV